MNGSAGCTLRQRSAQGVALVALVVAMAMPVPMAALSCRRESRPLLARQRWRIGATGGVTYFLGDLLLRTAFGAQNMRERERSSDSVQDGAALGAQNHQTRRRSKRERSQDRVQDRTALGTQNHEAGRGSKGEGSHDRWGKR